MAFKDITKALERMIGKIEKQKHKKTPMDTCLLIYQGEGEGIRKNNRCGTKMISRQIWIIFIEVQ